MRLLAAVIVVVATSLIAGSACAQSTAMTDPVANEREAIDRQTNIAIGLYVGGGVLLVAGVVGIPVGIIAVFSGSPRDGVPYAYPLFVGGCVSLGVGAALLGFAIGLHVNAERRRGRLGRASVAAGPGDVGLSLTLSF